MPIVQNSLFFNTKRGRILRILIWLLSYGYAAERFGYSMMSFLSYNNDLLYDNEWSEYDNKWSVHENSSNMYNPHIWNWMLVGWGIINILIGIALMWMGQIIIDNGLKSNLIAKYICVLWLSSIVDFSVIIVYYNYENSSCKMTNIIALNKMVSHLIKINIALGLIGISGVLIAAMYNIPHICRCIMKHLRSYTCECSCICKMERLYTHTYKYSYTCTRTRDEHKYDGNECNYKRKYERKYEHNEKIERTSIPNSEIDV